MTNPIECTRGEDGLWTVFYFGKTAGWIQKTEPKDRKVVIYKALTIHNSIKHFYSVNSAKDWIMGEYH